MIQLVTYEWEYFNIVNSSNFLLPELEKMKSCIYRVETTNTEMDL